MGTRSPQRLSRRGLFSGFFAAATLLLTSSATLAEAACRDDSVEISGDFGKVRFNVELARTPEEQGRGLMFREEMASSAGMLFLYDTPRTVSFWMRNTLIPLDMIFIAADGTIGRIHENAVPLDETGIPSQGRVIAVLEINGGLSSRIGITPGARVQHPLLATADGVPSC